MTGAVALVSNLPSQQTVAVKGGGSVAEIVIDLITELLEARGAALFACNETSLTLIHSQGLDQAALEAAQTTWGGAGSSLTAGMAEYGTNPRAFLLAPCLDNGAVRGLLYLETREHIPTPYLQTFTGILTRALRVLAGETPTSEVSYDGPADRQEMVALLDRNEWNLSRVARILGVTRMTIYNRLKRMNIPRQRVRRSQIRSARGQMEN